MKKFLFFMICTLFASLSSCTKDSAIGSTSNSDEITANFTIQLSDSATRSAYTDPTLANLRLYVIISKDDEVLTYSVIDNWDYSADGTASVSFRLGRDITYDVSAWADFGSQYYTVTCDSYPKVALACTDDTTASSYEITPSNMYDAYFAIDTVTFSNDNDSFSLSLSRPFGLVKVETSDLSVASIATTIPDAYKRLMVEIPTSLDLLTAAVGDKKFVSTTGATNGSELSFEYIFADETTELYDFTYEYYQNNSFISNYAFSNVPVKRNNITNISGDILTYGGNIQINLSPDWTSMEYVIYVNSETTEADLIAEVDKVLSYGITTQLSIVGTMEASELNFTNSALYDNSAATIVEINIEDLETTESGQVTNRIDGDLISKCWSVTTLYAPNSVGFINGNGDTPFSDDDTTNMANNTALVSLTLGIPYTENVTDGIQSDYVAGSLCIESVIYASPLRYLSLPNATTLGDYTLNYSDLEYIDLPKVTKIGEEVFNGCYSLTTLKLTSPDIKDPEMTGYNGAGYWKPTNSNNITLYLNSHMEAGTGGLNFYGFDFKEIIYVDQNGDPIY